MKITVSQIVFLMMATALVLAFLWGVYQGSTSLEDSKAFVGLVGMVFGYYFGKPATTQDELTAGVGK